MQVGHKIKRIRELKGLSQAEVAKKLFISQRAYSDIENDKTKLDLDRLEKLSGIFEMDPLDVLTFDEKQVFTNCTISGNSGNNYSTVYNAESSFENERQSYQQQIEHLEKEIIFLRNLINKN